jgi:nitrate reductase gamma subunit
VKPDVFFAAWPYITVGLLLVGIVVRYLLTVNHKAAIAAETLQASNVFGGSRVWQASMLVLLTGHLMLLGAPAGVLFWNRSVVRLYLLEAVFFVTGFIALTCCVQLIMRHVRQTSAPATVEVCDTVFWSLLGMALLTGSLMAVFYRWGSSWGAMTLSPYMASLLHGNPAARLITQMPFLVRLHVFCAFSALGAFPLTRPAAFLLLALDRAVNLAVRPATAIGTLADSWLRRLNPAAWIWPEED